MRNNEERVGPLVSPDEPVQETEPKQSFPAPTEMVDLPSQGKFYPEGSSLYGKSSIEMRFMTAKEEDILTNKSLLKKGLAIDRVLSSLIVDKSVVIDDLLVGDKNALLIAARISAYGAGYKTGLTCSQCGHKYEHMFDLGEIQARELSLSLSSDGTLVLVLPRTGATVCCRLLSGRDEKWMTQAAESKKKHKLPETPLTDQLKLIILSVNGDADKGSISKFVDSMPALDSRFLRGEYLRSVPDVNTDFTVSCPECETDSEVSMPLAAEFFWPK